jgi:hypothetical protein
MEVRNRATVGLIAAVAMVALLATPALAMERSMNLSIDNSTHVDSVPYWEQPIAKLAPTDPSSASIMSYIKADNTLKYLAVSGTASSGTWGTPVYNAHDGDATYAIQNNCQTGRPPEFASMRIPAGAKPDPTSDASMVVIDVGKGIEYGMWHAKYDPATRLWSSCGGTVYYLASNGLAGSLVQSNEKRNQGHRGVPPETYVVTYQEIAAGSIDHMLKIALDTTKCSHVFPMAGDECGTLSASAPPEGAIIRIKASVDLSKLGLSRAALIVARALQTYGAVVGDQSGGSGELKAENVVAEGRGWLWKNVLTSTSLSKITLDSYEVVKLGYGA